MRILHLANHTRDTGNGIVNVMMDLAVAQAAAGHEVVIASEACGFEALLGVHGVRHVSLPQRRPLQLFAALRRLRQLVKEFSPDIVHAHMVPGALLGRLARRRAQAGLSYGLVTTVHNEFQRSSDLMRLGDRVVAVSGAVAAAMARRGIPAERLRVVRNGTIGSARLASREGAAPLTLAGPSIVTVSGMYARKGVPDLIRAFALLRSKIGGAQLYCVGDGPDRALCEELARELGVADMVHFPGFTHDPRPYMRAADVFVLASHSESFSLVLSEAREAGCAIVATAVGGIPEVLQFGAAGMLVPAHNPALLAQALTSLLSDPVRLSQWRSRAAEGREWLSVERVQRDYLEVYRELQDIPAAVPTNIEQVGHG
jgi:glycosyltransferase involved in cell wall biosynthesis